MSLANKCNKVIILCAICEKETLTQGRSYESNNINISSCFFQRNMNIVGKGGVVLVDGGDFSMNISLSVFYNCVCTQDGGAIYFSSLSSDIRFICANMCSAMNGHFGCLYSTINKVSFLSISNCSLSNTGYWSNRLYSGNQRYHNTNSSMNKASQITGVCVSSPTSFLSSYCTFANNYANDCMCIYFASGYGIMGFANIVNNNSPNSEAVICVKGSGASHTLEYCIFFMNQNILFINAAGTSLSIFHSFISHNGVSSSENNNTITIFPTYVQYFYNTHYCNAEFPYVEIPLTLSITQTQSIGQLPQQTHYRSYDYQCSGNYAKYMETNVVFSFLYLVGFFLQQ